MALARFRPGDGDDDSVIVDADDVPDDASSDAESTLPEDTSAAIVATAPVHVTYDVVAKKSEFVDSDAALKFKQMLSADWYTNLGLGEPPFTVVTPKLRECHDFIFFTPVRSPAGKVEGQRSRVLAHRAPWS